MYLQTIVIQAHKADKSIQMRKRNITILNLYVGQINGMKRNTVYF